MKLEHTMNRLTDVIMPFATKVAENNYVKSLSESMQLLLPITITGSFAALFAFIDIGPWQDFLASNEIFALVLKNIQAWTTNLIAFFLAIILPYRYAENVGMKNAIGVVCAVMAGFLLLTPNEINVAMPVEWLGHKGMFTVMILSFIATRVMKIFIDRNWTIRMPAGVPKAIEGAFLDLIPAAVIIIICGIIGQLMALTDFRTVHQFIYTLIQIPVSNIGLSFGGLIIFETIATVSMFFGIHGEPYQTGMDPYQVPRSFVSRRITLPDYLWFLAPSGKAS